MRAPRPTDNMAAGESGPSGTPAPTERFVGADASVRPGLFASIWCVGAGLSCPPLCRPTDGHCRARQSGTSSKSPCCICHWQRCDDFPLRRGAFEKRSRKQSCFPERFLHLGYPRIRFVLLVFPWDYCPGHIINSEFLSFDLCQVPHELTHRPISGFIVTHIVQVSRISIRIICAVVLNRLFFKHFFCIPIYLCGCLLD